MAELASWQNGFDLDRLKMLAAPFKAMHAPLVFGAFGLTKEREVADALAEGRLIWTGRPAEACAIARPLSKDSQHSDFTGRDIELHGPCLMVGSIAARNPAAAERLVQAIVARAAGVRLYAEIFEEDAIVKTAMLREGFSYIGTKIMAGSEIKGLYVLGDAAGYAPLPSEEMPSISVIDPGFLAPELLAAVRDELEHNGPGWAQHYSSYNKRKSWTAFSLRGYDDDPGFIIKPAEMSKAWRAENPTRLPAKVRWTPAADQMPATMGLLAATGLVFDRVRFMRLAPGGGALSRHADITDREAGVADGKLTRLHVPIWTSPAVNFHGWDARGIEHRRHLPTGALCALDQRKPHSVSNTDPQLARVHLVADAYGCETLRRGIREADEARAQQSRAA